jgi:hypothetical protein
MIALLLVLGLFLYLTVVGQAVISLFKPRLGVLWSWFVAPTFGLATVVLLTTRLNVWGIPVKDFGPWMTLGLAVAAGAILWWRRPVFPWRHLLPFFALCAVYLLYTGWPMLRFGFDWISYGNDDMANYCLAADRFLNHGYYDIPLQTDLEGRNYAQHYWFMHALQQIRPGSELTVAWIAAITGLKAHEAFMPAILMLSLLQIFALGSIVIFRGRHRRLALLALVLFATSPLFGLGTLYQLIAQVGGIAILLTASSLLLSTRALTWRKAAVAGIMTACLGIFYPEVSPFVALSVGLFALRLRYRQMDAFKRYALFVVGAAVLTFILIGTNTYQFINTLVMQSVGSAGLGAMAEINDQSGGLVLFPWTLVPSFIPMLFGLHAFGVVGTDPLISIKVATGLLLLGYLLWRSWRNLKDEAPAGYLAVVMIALGFYLFYKGQDFGLFKLAMFIQPIVTLAMAQAFALLLFQAAPRVRRIGQIVVAVFIALTIPAHTYYSYASLGTYGGGLTEVVGASRLGVAFQPPTDLAYDGIHSDISNVVTSKMLAQYTQGIDTRFLSRSYMDNIANVAVLKFLRDPDPDLGPQARLVEKLSLLRGLLPWQLMEGDVPDYRVMTINKLDNNWTHTSSRHLDYRDRLFVAVRTELDHFNKFNPGDGWTLSNMYQYKLESEVKDRLIFVHSELSPHYYSSARFKAAFFQREPEPITDGELYFHGTGRFNVFNIINPSPNLRMVVDFSRTSLGEGRSKLPENAVIIGDADYPLPFVGHGSARVISPPVKPEYFDQAAYLTLDFGDQPQPIAKPKTGLMRLYGERFNLDDRRLVGFSRDISIITEEQYLTMERPNRIGDFPSDLARYPGLEYSGMYEDGWMAEDAYFKMGPSAPGQILTFKGYVPDTPGFRTVGVDITVSINEKPTEIVNVRSGEFVLTRLIREPVQITSIAMHFSGSAIYGDRDKRAVSAFVREISIDDIPDFAALRRMSNESGAHVTFEGVDEDGWIGHRASFTAPGFSQFKVLKIDMENPGAAPAPRNDVEVRLNGQTRETVTVPRANYASLAIPLTSGDGHTIELQASEVFPLPNDGRERGLLIKNLSFENVSPTDLYARGWHRSGYQFEIDRADNDGWVDRTIRFGFPATDRFQTAIVQVVRYPAVADLPLAVELNGVSSERMLGLEATETVRVPLSPEAGATLSLSATRSYPLAAPDTRSRSFRIVNIDFE